MIRRQTSLHFPQVRQRVDLRQNNGLPPSIFQDHATICFKSTYLREQSDLYGGVFFGSTSQEQAASLTEDLIASFLLRSASDQISYPVRPQYLSIKLNSPPTQTFVIYDKTGMSPMTSSYMSPSSFNKRISRPLVEARST